MMIPALIAAADNPFLKLLIDLVVLYGGAILFSSLAKSFRQPVVLGYIIGGMILGLLIGPETPFSALRDLLGGFTVEVRSGVLESFSQVGVIFLLFLAGIDSDFRELKNNLGKSFSTALWGVFAPFVLVFAAFALTGGDFRTSIAMGTVVTATSISISLQVLKNLGQLKSKVGTVTTGAAIIDDIVGIVLITLLGLFLGGGAGGGALPAALGRMAVLFGSIALIGYLVILVDRKLPTRGWRKRHATEIMMGVLIFFFLLSYFAQVFGVSAILGAYFGGLILSMTRLKETIEKMLLPVTEFFFAPVFFTSIGLSLDISGLGGVLLPGVLVGLLAVAGKGIGSGFGGRLAGLDRDSAGKLGAAMVPMGEVAFIVASLAKSMGVLEQKHLSMAVIVIIVTSISGPLLLRRAYRKG